ncbi:unnamed protein product [Rotaria sp. Silwood2]|nr:unnamed protein product [Rotaria sp. Silwood2]
MELDSNTLNDTDTDCDRSARETNDNVITVIESLRKHFIDDNDDCPRFFMDCLKKACEHAFSSTKTEERRPVLVYVQNRNSRISTIFDSFDIIDYLNENYIVWSWDINLESNRILLNNMWRDVFSCEFPYSRNVKEYPILIGIMRFYQEKKNDLFISAYQFKKLLQGYILRTENIYTEKILIDKLALFKAESDENERSLSFDFICKSGLCWNVIFEILEYLTLNDAISLFSANILPILRKYNRKIEVYLSSDTFIETILPKLKYEQIVSLRLNRNFDPIQSTSNSLRVFFGVTSLHLYNFYDIKLMFRFKRHFRKLIRISFWYDDQVCLHCLSCMLMDLPRSVKQLEIHSGILLCNDFHKISRYLQSSISNSIEYILIDIKRSSSCSIDDTFQFDQSFSFIEIADFFQNISNIRHIHLIINKQNINHFLNLDQWKILRQNCTMLNKITLNIIGNILEDEEFTQTLLKIQTELQKIVKFRFTYI